MHSFFNSHGVITCYIHSKESDIPSLLRGMERNLHDATERLTQTQKIYFPFTKSLELGFLV
jgi:hypothetical protein